MAKSKKKRFNKLLLLISLLLILYLGFLYKEHYLNCVFVDFQLCITSKQYTSPDGSFTFRYLNDYPLTAKSGKELEKEYGFDDNYDKWINFSNEFYPNAGGDRLGSVIIDKNSPYENVEEYGKKILNDHNKLPEEFKETPPNVEYIKIGGKKAVRITTAEQSSSFNPTSDEYILIHDGKLYNISFYYNDYYHKLPIQHYQRGKELILSTFTLN